MLEAASGLVVNHMLLWKHSIALNLQIKD